MLFLLLTATLVVVLLAGAVGSKVIGDSAVPLVDALKLTGNSTIAMAVNLLGLAGLIASFFSIIYGYSRLVFALSRAGYLPQTLSLTSDKKVPSRALLVPEIDTIQVFNEGGHKVLTGLFAITHDIDSSLLLFMQRHSQRILLAIR